MRSFHVQSGRIALGADLIPIGDDYLVILGGGERHIGAIALAFPDDFSALQEMPGHREGEIAAMMAERLAAQTGKKIVVVSGIHYDKISKSEIEDVKMLVQKITTSIINQQE